MFLTINNDEQSLHYPLPFFIYILIFDKKKITI
jgi:hypothetical protein